MDIAEGRSQTAHHHVENIMCIASGARFPLKISAKSWMLYSVLFPILFFHCQVMLYTQLLQTETRPTKKPLPFHKQSFAYLEGKPRAERQTQMASGWKNPAVLTRKRNRLDVSSPVQSRSWMSGLRGKGGDACKQGYV